MTTTVKIEAQCDENIVVKAVTLDLENHFIDTLILEHGHSSEFTIQDEQQLIIKEIIKK